jgi:catalase
MRLIATLWLATAALAFALPRALADEQVTPNAVVKALEDDFGVHPGQRRNHTKGTCATGSFVGLPDAASYSRSALFSGTTSLL